MYTDDRVTGGLWLPDHVKYQNINIIYQKYLLTVV